MADNLKRIADALDGGDPNVGKPTEEGNLKRIADYIEENGMGGGSVSPLIIEIAGDGTTNKTWNDVNDALTNGVPVYGSFNFTVEGATLNAKLSVMSTFKIPEINTYVCVLYNPVRDEMGGPERYTASSPDAYLAH